MTANSKGGKDKKISVAWPQDLAFVGTLRKRPQYEDLTQTQWILGFLRIAQEENNPEFRAHMYDYLTELMQNAADNTWAAAKGAHAVLMHRMQDGVLDWGDIKKIHKIRKTYARAIVHSGTDYQTKKGSGNGVPCRNYQTGSCGFPGNHDINGLHVKHICAHCFTSVGKEHKHAKKDCNRLKNVSKNNGTKFGSVGGALGVDSASANGEEFVNLHSSPNSACPYMVNLLGGYQDVMNECTQVDAHNVAVQSAFQSPHTSLSKYGHVILTLTVRVLGAMLISCFHVDCLM